MERKKRHYKGQGVRPAMPTTYQGWVTHYLNGINERAKWQLKKLDMIIKRLDTLITLNGGEIKEDGT